MIDFIELIGILLQGIITLVIIDKISGIKHSRKVYIAKGVCICFNMLIWHYIKEVESIRYSIGIVLDTLNFSLYLIILRRQKLLDMFASLMTSNIINTFLGLMVAFFIYFTVNVNESNVWYPLVLIFGYLLKFVPLYLLVLIEKRFIISQILKKTNAKIIVIAMGVLIQIVRQPIFLFAEKSENRYVSISITILVMVVAFCILYGVDWYFAERERKRMWEDNQRMAGLLHKSKEILPLLNNTLAKMKDDDDSKEFGQILNEVHQLCNELIKESENEDMEFKNFPSTGIHILDEQIQLYGKEAANKGINFDIFVSMPMAGVLKEFNVLQLDFLRFIGELMRNAFRAIEKAEEIRGNILLVMGSVNGVLELEIYDDGLPFPIHILNEFGKRGNTDGGTGHGIAEVLEIVKRYNATFKLTEYQDNNGFTKGISIIWNQQNGRFIETFRRNQISEDSALYYENFKIAEYPVG